ncbi:MAG: nitrate reductase cytochrome c-type subunit [Gallionella sp.]|nr:nitrate reductase cytochrome c-type subunit [Gallionella sp.]
MRNNFKLISFNLLACLALLVSATSHAAQPIPANDMGLSKGSVFDVPEPKVSHYPSTAPGESSVLPRAYLGAPPQIPHDISDFLPITAQTNMCVACHNQPALRGGNPAKGTVVPIPVSHYTDHRIPHAKTGDNLINARYNCNQCHVPQSDAPALVGNSFSSKRKR